MTHDIHLMLQPRPVRQRHALGEPGQGDAHHGLQHEVHLGSVTNLAKVEAVLTHRLGKIR